MDSLTFLSIDFQNGTSIVIQGQTSLRAINFSYVDDVSYLCDMAELEINSPYGIVSEGASGNNLVDQIAPLLGTEKVILRFGDDLSSRDGYIEVEMDIFRIREKPASPQSNLYSLIITMVNSKLSNFITPAKTRSFQGSYSSVADSLATEAGIPKRIIEPTEGSKKSILQTYWTDAQLLRNMSERSVGSENRSTPFIYHVRENEFHYHSYQYIYKGDKYKVKDTIYGYTIFGNESYSEQVKKSRFTAIDWIGTIRNKFFEVLGGGGLSGAGIDHKKGYLLRSQTGLDVFQAGQQLAAKLPIKTDDIQTTGRFQYTGLRNSDEIEAVIKNLVSFPQENMLEVEILLRGKADRKSCRVINFMERSGLKNYPESKYSGLYFIKGATHVFQNGDYYTKLNLVRGGYNVSKTSTPLASTTNIKRE